MDTKSKKYKIIRFICFFLCLLCVGTSAFSVCRVAAFGVKAGYFYGTDNFKIALHDARRSTYFLNEVGLAYYSVRRAYITYDEGEIFESDSFKKHLEEKKENDIQDYVNQNSKQLEKRAEEYNKQYKADPYASEYWVDGYGWLFPEAFESWDSYTVNDDGTVSVNYDTLRQEAVANFEEQYDLTAYKNEYKHLKSYISRLGALEYFLVDNTTGEIFTNSSFKTADEFKKAYMESTWFVSSDDNFESATVGTQFKSISDSSSVSYNFYGNNSDDIAQTHDGIILGDSNYLYEFFTAIRYGYSAYYSSLGYIVGPSSLFEAGPCTVYLSFDESRITADDPFEEIYSEYYDTAKHLERDVTAGVVALILLAIFSFVILHLAGKKPISLNWQNKVPGEIHFVLSVGLAVGCGALGLWLGVMGADTYYNYRSEWFSYLWWAGSTLAAVLCYSFLLNGFVTLIQSIKGKVFVHNLLIVMPYRFVKMISRRLADNSSDLKKGVRRQYKILIPIYLAASAFCWFIIAAADDAGFILLGITGLVLVNIILCVLLYYYAKALDKIRETVTKSQQGDFDIEFNCNSMPQPMVNLAEDISEMRDGMKVAIDSAVKAQQAKTELITNVSHDLKTPLTSIITYTDLIQRSSIEDETVQGYAAVLVEKSMRLKQLIDDLTEATKVSTGAVELQLTEVSLCELAMQAIGENEDALEKSGIDVRFITGDIKPVVIADGQKTYRVLENVISNITKYAMSGTRAYVTVAVKDGMGVVVFQNISSSPLNISADELMERFVRGDAARSGEGSGLGLSIAKDLCELQGGKFEIHIEGDMFTSRVFLPLSENNDLYNQQQ